MGTIIAFNEGKPGEKLTCTRCGANLMNLQHDFCVDCGTKTDFGLRFDLEEVQKSHLFQKLVRIHNLYVVENKDQHSRMVSKEAFDEIAILSRDEIASLKNIFSSADKSDEWFSFPDSPLADWIINAFYDGYFCWLAEAEIKGRTLMPSRVNDREKYHSEAVAIYRTCLDDYQKASSGHRDPESKILISDDTARVIAAFALTTVSNGFVKGGYFNERIGSLRYEIQSALFRIMVRGYSMALHDDQYRK